MASVSLRVCGKVNLTLDVREKRPDGYHEIHSILQTIGLSDTITLCVQEDGGWTFMSNRQDLPVDDGNLTVAAGRRFQEETGISIPSLSISLEKQIPVCAGMGGGSADAAAVLVGLNHLLQAGLSEDALETVGAKIGSDVPFFIRGGAALAEGRGERLTPVTGLPSCWIVVVKPSFSVATPELFRRFDEVSNRSGSYIHRPDTETMSVQLSLGDLHGISAQLGNVFEAVLPAPEQKLVFQVKSALKQAGALGASMTGTGSAVYGIFSDRRAAEQAQTAVQIFHPESVFLTQPVSQACTILQNR